MKVLVVYYSRTGTTKLIGDKISEELKADVEEIISVKNRKGIFGYLLCGKEGMKKIAAEIKETKKDPALYDLVVIGIKVVVMRPYVNHSGKSLTMK